MQNTCSMSSNGDVMNAEVVKMLAGPIVHGVLLEEMNDDALDDVDGVTDKDVMKELEQIKGEDTEKATREAKEIAHQILYIADTLIGPELEKNRIIERIEQITTEQGFNAVANEYISQGGATTWGRVATFIYVSCKCAIKALSDTLRGIPVFGKIIHWTIEFIQNKLVPWISRVGGWNAVLDRPSNRPPSNRPPPNRPNEYGSIVLFGLGLVVGSFLTYKFITMRHNRLL